MPKILEISGYQISVWSNENNEPIHVHISKRRPTANSPKLWMLSNGRFVKADPKDKRIPEHVLNKIIAVLEQNPQLIRNFWVAYHKYEKYIK